nr:MAG TPA: hypothetical protein [Inoviridae sp.]
MAFDETPSKAHDFESTAKAYSLSSRLKRGLSYILNLNTI